MTTYPETRREVVHKTVGGISFDDPYAWLQVDNEETLAWQWAQDEIARTQLAEGRERLREAIAAAVSKSVSQIELPPRKAGDRWFWLKGGDSVWLSDSPFEAGSLWFDATDLARALATTSKVYIRTAEPTPDGTRLLLSLTFDGAADEHFYFLDVNDAPPQPIFVFRFPYVAGVAAWMPDGEGVWIGGERYEDGHLHLKYLAPNAPRYPEAVFTVDDIPFDVPMIAAQVSPGGRSVIAISGPHEWTAYQIGAVQTGTWRRFVPADFRGECYGNWIDDEHYAAICTEGAPRGRVVIIPIATSQDRSTWREIIPETNAVLRNLLAVGNAIVLAELHDVSVRVRAYHLDGTPAADILSEPFAHASLTNRYASINRSDALIFTYGTFTRAGVMVHYDFAAQALHTIGAAGETLAHIAVDQQFAVNKDGTHIPYFRVYRSDLDLSQPQPTLITGYGGFNIAQMPHYLGALTPFVEAGGVYVRANLRGGSEYGSIWHAAGRLKHKQNTFDDLYAVAEDLIRAGVTRPDKLAMSGRSNGGLLAGVALTQRPDLWRVVVPVVPLLDMLEPIAPGPVAEAIKSFYVQDYGDPDDPEFSAVLYAYSPYHNVRDGTTYPAVLQVFGEKDLGCPAYHGRKFTARLQAATTSGLPILLRVWKVTGHAAAGNTAIDQDAEIYAFIMRELGMTF